MRVLADLFDSPNRADTLLVLLPPAEAKIEDFYAHGFIAELRRRKIGLDLMLAEVTYQHVMSKTTVSALREHVVGHAQTLGYRHIWLAGISMGAFNALHYASAHPDSLAGVHLIAPYPGTGDILAEIIAAGGPGAWAQAFPANQEDERAWWHWLCRESTAQQKCLPVYFSSGSEDRFLRGQRMIADLLPGNRVRFLPGAHAWTTWQVLWQDWLDHGPFAQATRLPQESHRP